MVRPPGYGGTNIQNANTPQILQSEVAPSPVETLIGNLGVRLGEITALHAELASRLGYIRINRGSVNSIEKNPEPQPPLSRIEEQLIALHNTAKAQGDELQVLITQLRI